MFEEIFKNALNSKISDTAYDAFRPQEDVASERGLVCRYPKVNELFIDIDSEEQLQEFHRRSYYFGFSKNQITITPSASGPPHWHAVIITEKEYTDIERIAWQAALNDDPLKVFLSVLRVQNNMPNPTTLFEKPKQ